MEFLLHEPHYVKYLGILIVNRLNWAMHMKELMKKLSRDISLLSKIKHFVTDSTLKHLYHSLSHSHLMHGCILWNSASDIQLHQICRLQKQAIRTIIFSKYNDHTLQHFRNLKIFRLDDILRLQQLLFMHDFDKN